MNIIKAGFTLGALLCAFTVQAQNKTIPQRVDSVMRLMTLQEKIGQLNQYSGRDATGPVTVKQTNMLNDIKAGLVGSMLNVKGVKDVRAVQAVAMQSRLKIPLLFGVDIIHGYKTIFPIPLAQAASWDMEAIRLSEQVAATEGAAAGQNWTFSPMVDIARDPRWGRIMEGSGEDTYLGVEIAKARVLGFQGNKLGAATNSIMACAKHFAAYGAVTAGRDYNDVEMSDHLLWETYMPPFKAAADAGAATFMTSFNTLNGIPTVASTYLQRDVLKRKWNYLGFVVSDWGSIEQMVPWGYADNVLEASYLAFKSGCDMDMGDKAYLSSLPKLAEAGRLNLKLLDDAVKRILTKKFEMGLFDDPYRFCNDARETKQLNNPEHKALARKVAQKTLVLLKNEGNILPLQKKAQKIALIGPLVDAKRDLDGNWTPTLTVENIVTIHDGFKNKLGKNAALTYTKGSAIETTDTTGFAEAVKAAQQADVVVMALGESWDMSGESKSRGSLDLPGNQQQLFNAIHATGKPVVVVLLAGRPLTINAIAQKASAIVYAWWPGEQGGNAIADVLFGDHNPSGKLPVTFPRSVGQIPITYAGYNTGHPLKNPKDKQYKSAYIDMENSPLYAFGYGLSYTKFEYSNLKLSKNELTQTDSVQVSFTLTNTGKLAGEEVVQLYIHDVQASVVQPLKKLKGFKKMMLKPGESKTVSFTINNEMLAFYNAQMQWASEPGKFNLMIGAAADDICLQDSFVLKAVAP